MDVYDSYKDLPEKAQGSVIAIGNFDGVHRGHIAVLEVARKKAQELNAPLGLLTFEPHPHRLFHPDDAPFRITSFPVKERRLQKSNVDLLFSVPFDWTFASLHADQFIENVLRNGIQPAHIVIGDDFRFGQLRKGTADMLREEGYDVTIVQEQRAENGVRYSSSVTRMALQAGDISATNYLLGWDWEIQGEVVHGEKVGRTLGFPTANIHLVDTIHPAYGVYASLAKIEEDGPDGPWMPSAMNIGIRPMFKVTTGLLEVHIFDFDRDIYGKTLRVRPVKRMRGEAKFDSVDDLKAQIAIDCDKAKEILS